MIPRYTSPENPTDTNTNLGVDGADPVNAVVDLDVVGVGEKILADSDHVQVDVRSLEALDLLPQRDARSDT